MILIRSKPSGIAEGDEITVPTVFLNIRPLTFRWPAVVASSSAWLGLSFWIALFISSVIRRCA